MWGGGGGGGACHNVSARSASSEQNLPGITSVWTDENIIFVIIDIVHTT